MFNDLIDLMGVQSRNIEYYEKYPLVLIFFIMLLLQIPSFILLPGDEHSISSNLTTDLILAFGVTFIEAIFFVYWFRRIGKNYSFSAFLHYDVMLSIAATIPYILILFVIKYFDSIPWVGVFGGLGAISYVIYMFTLNLAKATESSGRYAFIAIILVIVIQAIVDYFPL